MRTDVDIKTKQPAESRVYAFDFAPRMQDGDSVLTINSHTWTPSGLTIGTPSPVAQEVQVRLGGGTNDANYSGKCVVTTVFGDVLECDAKLFVKER